MHFFFFAPSEVERQRKIHDKMTEPQQQLKDVDKEEKKKKTIRLGTIITGLGILHNIKWKKKKKIVSRNVDVDYVTILTITVVCIPVIFVFHLIQ